MPSHLLAPARGRKRGLTVARRGGQRLALKHLCPQSLQRRERRAAAARVVFVVVARPRFPRLLALGAVARAR